jgi:predicted nuclease of predicted toxin-antitoxin system
MPLLFSIVADENIPGEVVAELRRQGCKVYWIAAEKPGISDLEVWQIAAGRSALLLTRDKGYLPQLKKDEILNGPRVVVYRSNGIQNNELQSAELFLRIVCWYFRECAERDWHYVVVSVDGKHRTRRQCWGDEQLRRKTL